jgi:two-component system, LytTR family, response regulator LytT
MKVVIIEDEGFTALDLADTIRELRSNYSIIKILSSVKEAVDYFSGGAEVDLVFSDIHLGDGLSFDFFKTGLCKSPVIFCTAYDNYAIQAFKANGIDYVLKPVGKSEILRAIEKFERMKGQQANLSEMMGNLAALFKPAAQDQSLRSILVHHKDKIIPVKLQDIAVFYIHNDGTRIIDLGGRSYSVNESLEDIERLQAPFLFRASRQHIVNRSVVKEASQHFGRKLVLNLSLPFEEQISVSKEKVSSFLKWLQNS